MNRYESNKRLKEAIVGYVSSVFSRLKSAFRFQSLSMFLQHRINEAMLACTKSIEKMPQEERVVLSLISRLGKYQLPEIFPLSLITLEGKLQNIFEQFNVDINFLSDFNFSIMDFAYFIIELADRITDRKKRDAVKGVESDDQEILEEEVKRLIVRRYTRIDVSIVPIIVERLGSVALVFEMSYSFRSILQISVVDAQNGSEQLSFHEADGIRCMIVEELEGGLDSSGYMQIDYDPDCIIKSQDVISEEIRPRIK